MKPPEHGSLTIPLDDMRSVCNLTQGEVAKAMGWTLAKVRKIERYELMVSRDKFRQLIIAIGNLAQAKEPAAKTAKKKAVKKKVAKKKAAKKKTKKRQASTRR